MKLKTLISSSLAVGLIFNSNLPSLASTLSDDRRYEAFEGSSIVIDNVLETEDNMDIEIEGNTIINVANQKDSVAITSSNSPEGASKFNLHYLYPNTEYTIQFESDNTGKINRALLSGVEYQNYSVKKGINRFNITTPDEISSNELILDGSGFNLFNLVVTEAIEEEFNYFEGIKSVGQDDENGHGIKITSNNYDKYTLCWRKDNKQPGNMRPELIDEWTLSNKTSLSHYGILIDISSYSVGSNIKISNAEPFNRINTYSEELIDNNSLDTTSLIRSIHGTNDTILEKSFVKEENENYLFVGVYNLSRFSTKVSINDKMFSSNTLEIPLSNPLRGFPGAVKDKIIKRNDEWIVERNFGEVVLDGSSDEGWTINNPGHFVINKKCNPIQKFGGIVLCDKIASSYDSGGGSIPNTIWAGNNQGIQTNKFTDVNTGKAWLSQNPITVVYELQTPIYETLNIGSTINTYLDTTYISNSSNVPANMKVTVDRAANRAVEAIELARTNPTDENLSAAEYWTNLLEESTLKDELQSAITDIINKPSMELERKTVTSNMDLYVSSENMLSMSLDTNSVTFDSYSGVAAVEIEDAIDITINSSLPYNLNAYMPSEIISSDGLKTMPIDILNIRENNEGIYKQFESTSHKVTLKENCQEGNNINHLIDLKLDSSDAHVSDIYKTVIKFEAEQK